MYLRVLNFQQDIRTGCRLGLLLLRGCCGLLPLYEMATGGFGHN